MLQFSTDGIDAIFEGRDSTIALDLKLNLKRLLGDGQLSPDEAGFALLATAKSVGHERLEQYAADQLRGLGSTDEMILEARESAAIMGMLNTYYKFKKFVGKEEDYRTAGLRMTALARPVLGREKFEMLAFAVSVINGCENCVVSHEQALRNANVAPDKIHDLARLASILKGISAI